MGCSETSQAAPLGFQPSGWRSSVVSGIPQYSEVELPQWHENRLPGAWHCVLVKDKVSFVCFPFI